MSAPAAHPHVKGCKLGTALASPAAFACFCPKRKEICEDCDPCTCAAIAAAPSCAVQQIARYVDFKTAPVRELHFATVTADGSLWSNPVVEPPAEPAAEPLISPEKRRAYYGLIEGEDARPTRETCPACQGTGGGDAGLCRLCRGSGSVPKMSREQENAFRREYHGTFRP